MFREPWRSEINVLAIGQPIFKQQTLKYTEWIKFAKDVSEILSCIPIFYYATFLSSLSGILPALTLSYILTTPGI